MFQSRDEFLRWLRSIEKKWQSKWREAHLFEANLKPGAPKFYITVPYPYANGPLHIGHGRTYTIGDIVARYKRLRGFNVLYPMAFHITGTPIMAFSEMISRGDQKTISMYREYIKLYVEDEYKVEEILESFKNPLNLAVFFAERIQRDFEELGYSIDWRRKFHTGEPIYHNFVTWQFYKLMDKGLITRGEHIVTYCLLHQQPEGEDDILDADVNPVEIVEFTAVKFKLEDSDVYLLAGTLRPETLLGAVNMWINPQVEYVVFKWRGDKYIVSNEAFLKLKYQYPEEEFIVIKTISGRELLGKYALSPLNQKRLLILPAQFVDPDNATGIVYSEPSDAPYDYVALVELKRNPDLLKEYGIDPSQVTSIEPVKIIDIPGIKGHHAEEVVKNAGIESQNDPRLEEITSEVYKEQFYKGIIRVDDPEFNGLSVRDAREKMKNKLYMQGYAIPFYELNRKAWCRAKGKIIVAKISGQWFINYNLEWLKSKAREIILSNKLIVIPSKYTKQFLDVLDWLDKRPCARKRGIGTKLPWDSEWIIESLSDSTIYMAFYTIAHIIREKGIQPNMLIPEVFDYVFLGQGDVSDVSTKSGIPVSVLEEMRREFMYWYPVDQRHTGIPHISNHLTFYILHHIALFPMEQWPRIISLNETVIREGAKMSKSKGNVIPLRHVTTMYSADLFRLYIAWAAELDSVLDWREAEVLRVLDNIMRFTNITKQAVETACEERGDDIFTRWFMSKFNEIIEKATVMLENMEIRKYIQYVFFDVLTLVDKYRELKGLDYICGVKEILREWITLLNPVIPHLTEEINSWLGNSEFLSVSSWPEVKKPIEEDLVILVDNIDKVISDIREIIALLKKPVNTVYIIIAPEWKREIARLVLSGVQLKMIIEAMKTKFGLKGREIEIVDAFNTYKKMDKADLERIAKTTSKREYEVMLAVTNYLQRKLGVNISIIWEEEARHRGIPRAERALPLKPALYVE
jgi:leucyl-tRNA synthetase